MPLIVRYPPFTRYKPGEICHAFTTCMDLLPTYLDLAGATHPNPAPAHAREKMPYRGREVYGMRGKSWVPHLTAAESDDGKNGASYAIHEETDAPTGWEMQGRASLRQGPWKIVFIPVGQPTGMGRWQLYNLDVDQGETRDVHAEHPDRLASMIKAWEAYQEETGTVFGPPIGPPNINPHTGRPSLLPDQVGGDPVDDQKIWMDLGAGNRFRDSPAGAVKTAL